MTIAETYAFADRPTSVDPAGGIGATCSWSSCRLSACSFSACDGLGDACSVTGQKAYCRGAGRHVCHQPENLPKSGFLS